MLLAQQYIEQQVDRYPQPDQQHHHHRHQAPRHQSPVQRLDKLPVKKTSADNPFRSHNSGPSSPEEDVGGVGSKAEGNMKALLVGEGEGPGGDILLQLEAAISRGDHRYAATLAKELAKVKISSRLTEQEDRRATQPPPVKTIK